MINYISNVINIMKYNYPYLIIVVFVVIGFYLIIYEKNLIKKVTGLNLLQLSVIYFYILGGKINDSLPPIHRGENLLYVNPLPQVLMLTAIVVGIATTSLAYALIYRIYKKYGTIDDQKIIKK